MGPISKTKSGKQRLNYDVDFMSNDEYKKMIEKFFLPHCFDVNKSPMDVIIDAFATTYEHATAWLWIEKQDGIELEIAFHSDFPSVHFDLFDVIESACDFDPELNDQSVENINKIILSLEGLRERIEKGKFNL